MVPRFVFHTPVESKSKIMGTLKRKKQITQGENMEIGLLGVNEKINEGRTKQKQREEV